MQLFSPLTFRLNNFSLRSPTKLSAVAICTYTLHITLSSSSLSSSCTLGSFLFIFCFSYLHHVLWFSSHSFFLYYFHFKVFFSTCKNTIAVYTDQSTKRKWETLLLRYFFFSQVCFSFPRVLRPTYTRELTGWLLFLFRSYDRKRARMRCKCEYMTLNCSVSRTTFFSFRFFCLIGFLSMAGVVTKHIACDAWTLIISCCNCFCCETCIRMTQVMNSSWSDCGVEGIVWWRIFHYQMTFLCSVSRNYCESNKKNMKERKKQNAVRFVNI